VIYRNPRKLPPFATRGDPGPLDSTLALRGGVSGAEGAYYAQLRLDCEAFRLRRQAEESYLLALRFGRTEPANYVHAATWLARCLWKRGHRRSAVELLAEAEARAPGPRESAQLGEVRAALLASGRVPSPAPGSGVSPPPRPRGAAPSRPGSP